MSMKFAHDRQIFAVYGGGFLFFPEPTILFTGPDNTILSGIKTQPQHQRFLMNYLKYDIIMRVPESTQTIQTQPHPLHIGAFILPVIICYIF